MYALKPLTTGELLDRTFLFYRRHFLLFVGIAAVPGVMTLLVNLWSAGMVPRSAGGALVGLVLSLATIFIYLISTALSQGATMIAVSQIQLGRTAHLAEVFGTIRSRLGELSLLVLNVGIRILIGFILLIIPGILLALRYSLAVPVAVLEERGITESLARSADLTQGYRGRIFLIYVLLIVLSAAATFMWQVPVTLVLAFLAWPLRTDYLLLTRVILQVGSFVVQSVVGPIATIAISLVYYDVRVRKEAFDLEHMMGQLDGGGPVASPVT